MCGWCGKKCMNLQALGGHVKMHQDDASYPRMPRPSKDIKKALEDEGTVEMIKVLDGWVEGREDDGDDNEEEEMVVEEGLDASEKQIGGDGESAQE
jgi:hypothetical protein